MTGVSIATLIALPLAAVLAPLLSAGLARFVRIPLVVFEIVLGVVIGPSVLGVVRPSEFTAGLSSLGVAMLFFLAGNEIDVARIRGRPLNRSVIGWLISLLAGVVIGIVLTGSTTTGVFVGIALTSTALGTLMPVLRDAGELRTPFGTAVIAVGAAGEFGPLIAISIFLSGRQPGLATAVLLGFVVLATVAILLAGRTHPRLHGLITATLHTSGQFAVRLVLLILLGLVALSVLLDLDMLLGAFTAGVITRLLLSDATPADAEMVEAKLEAVGFGFLVPVFFINTGVTFDLAALVASPSTLILLPAGLVLFVLVRGLPGLISSPAGAAGAERAAMALFAATGLPVIVAVTGIGVASGDLPSGTAAALVGAGMLSVLIFPAVALSLHRRAAHGVSRPPDTDPRIDDEG